MVAPAVGQLTVTVWGVLYVPADGLKVGVAVMPLGIPRAGCH